MSPKEKADELVKKMYEVRSGYVSMITYHFAKQCALVAVDEIEKALTDYGSVDSFQRIILDAEFRYWDKVKMEINNL